MLMVLPSVLPEYFTRVLKRLNLLYLRDYFMTGVFVISFSVGPSAELIDWLLNQLVFHIQTKGYITELQKVMGKNPIFSPIDRVKIAILTRLGTLSWFTLQLLNNNTLEANDYGKYYHGLNITSFERLWLMLLNSRTQFYETKPFGYLTVNIIFEKDYLELLLAWVENKLTSISPTIVPEYKSQQSWGYSPRVNGDLTMLSKVISDFTFVPFTPMPNSQFQLPIGEVIICPDENHSKDREKILELEKVHYPQTELIDKNDIKKGKFCISTLTSLVSDNFGFFINNKIRPNKWMFSYLEMTGTVHTLDVDNITPFSIALNMLFCTHLINFDVFNMIWMQIYNVTTIIAPGFQNKMLGTNIPFPLTEINANYNQYVFELFTGIPMHYSGSVSPTGLNPPTPSSAGPNPSGPKPEDSGKPSNPNNDNGKGKSISNPIGRKGGPSGSKNPTQNLPKPHPKPNSQIQAIENTTDLSLSTSDASPLQIDVDGKEFDISQAESVADKLENAVRTNRFSNVVKFTKDGASLLYRGVKILNMLQRIRSGNNPPPIVNNLVNRITTSITNVQHTNPALLEGIW